MARLTVTLSDDRHRALKETAARRGKTIGEVIDESLEMAGVRTLDEARSLVALARSRAALSAEEAGRLAVEETRESRRQ